MFSFVALVQLYGSPNAIVTTMAATGKNMAKPPILTADRRFLACQYVNILPILKERLANIQDQFLQSLKSIFLEALMVLSFCLRGGRPNPVQLYTR